MPNNTATANNNTANKETKVTAKTAETTAPASDPKPRVRTRKAATAEPVATPKPTEQQLARMFKTAMDGATRANKAFTSAVESVSEDPRTVERANHLQEKAIAARQLANERAVEAGKDKPFGDDELEFTAIEAKSDKVVYNVVIQNMTDGTVQGHIAGCSDIGKRKRGKANPSDEPWELGVTSKRDAYLEYNSDFIAESGTEEGHWEIEWLPCADSVPEDDTQPEPETKREPFAAKAPKSAVGSARKAAAPKKAAATTDKPVRTTEKAKTPKPEVNRTEVKANALVKVAEESGWDVTVESGENGSISVECRDAKGGERIVTWFIDGKMDDTRMPAYYRAGSNVPVMLRNVSAVRQQMDPDLTKRPVKMEVTRVRGERKSDSDRPRKSFTWDNELGDDELLAVLQTELAGKRLCWTANLTGEPNGGEPQEVLVGKVAKVYTNPKTNDRLLEFFSLEYSEKDKGMKSGGQRTVALAKITRVI